MRYEPTAINISEYFGKTLYMLYTTLLRNALLLNNIKTLYTDLKTSLSCVPPHDIYLSLCGFPTSKCAYQIYSVCVVFFFGVFGLFCFVYILCYQNRRSSTIRTRVEPYRISHSDRSARI